MCNFVCGTVLHVVLLHWSVIHFILGVASKG